MCHLRFQAMKKPQVYLRPWAAFKQKLDFFPLDLWLWTVFGYHPKTIPKRTHRITPFWVVEKEPIFAKASQKPRLEAWYLWESWLWRSGVFEFCAKWENLTTNKTCTKDIVFSNLEMQRKETHPSPIPEHLGLGNSLVQWLTRNNLRRYIHPGKTETWRNVLCNKPAEEHGLIAF